MNFRNVINFQVHLLCLAPGLLEDMTRENGLFNVYIVHQHVPLSKTG